jgi:FHS family L-fucose permease-like MFS transporter
MKNFLAIFRTADGQNRAVTFALVSSLFLLWGLGNGMIDVLNKQFQNSLGISKANSGLVQGVWYAAYFLMAFPSGLIASRWGYRGGILSGLVIVVIGCVLFMPVAKITWSSTDLTFAAFLFTLFIVGSGLAFLETVANPYTTVLGPTASAVTRINLAQSCNGVGWIVGPIIGSTFILSQTEKVNTSNASLYIPYMIIAAVVAVMVAVFLFAPMPDIQAPQEAKEPTSIEQKQRPIYHEKHLLLGVASQFCYVAAQTGIFSFFINYVKDDRYMPTLPPWLADMLPNSMKYLKAGDWHITDYAAGLMLSGAFIFFTLGRFSGSVILSYCKPHITLGVYGLINVVMMFLVYLGLGWASVLALFLSYFFMSIMYPTHFALAIRGLGKYTKLGASCMVTAILGGAFTPYIMGKLADNYGMGVGFLLPMVCFFFIMLYGFMWRSLFTQDMEPEAVRAFPTH